MRLRWTSRQQRAFDALIGALRIADRVVPRDLWLFGYQLYLWDTRSRALTRQTGGVNPTIRQETSMAIIRAQPCGRHGQ